MQRNLLEYLENTVVRLPDKLAYGDENYGLSFQEVYNQSRAIGTFLSKEGIYKEPVVVFMKKQPKTLAAFFGTIYGGCFYVPLDEEMPRFRIEMIFEKLQPRAVICDESTEDILKTFNLTGKVYPYDSIAHGEIDEGIIQAIRDKSIDTDPIYVVFTSGSTGVPKGVVACHRSVIDYIDNLSEVLEVTEETIFGNQTPFYFDACLKEVCGSIKCGATTYIIPKSHFMFPLKLVEFLNEYKINTVCWVVSALTMISSFKVLEKLVPKYLSTIAFGSEVFPIKQFKLWRQALPQGKFINLYGPTEGTGMSCYYIVDRDFELDEAIPIGRPFKNTEILLLDKDNKRAKEGEEGEKCITRTALTLGYYKDLERTQEVYVQNPLNDAYPEIIYRTGDLGRYNDRGELMFISRKDYQIKHMGHRIELGEIEVNVNALEGIKSSCCLYDKDRDKILLFYTGEIEKKDVALKLKEKLPRYMIPNHIEVLEVMPLTANGKLDRVTLKNNYIKKKEK